MKIKGKLVLVLIVILLLIGCGKEETKLEETAELTQDVVEETETVGEENVEVAETDQAEEESEEEEKATKEQEETSDEMAEAQITTTVDKAGSISDYMESLDPQKPAIVIYNPDDGTIINMKEGEHYSLKEGDQIIVNISEAGVGYGYDLDIITWRINDNLETGYQLLPDYSKFESRQKFWFKRQKENGEILQITCYLSPPTE